MISERFVLKVLRTGIFDTYHFGSFKTNVLNRRGRRGTFAPQKLHGKSAAWMVLSELGTFGHLTLPPTGLPITIEAKKGVSTPSYVLRNEGQSEASSTCDQIFTILLHQTRSLRVLRVSARGNSTPQKVVLSAQSQFFKTKFHSQR